MPSMVASLTAPVVTGTSPAAQVAGGRAFETITMLLAAFAAEHTATPFTQPVIPVPAATCVLGLDCVGNPDPLYGLYVQHCIISHRLLSRLSRTRRRYFSDTCEDKDVFVPIYVPGTQYIRAMSLASALGRRTGHLRQRIPSCFSPDIKERPTALNSTPI